MDLSRLSHLSRRGDGVVKQHPEQDLRTPAAVIIFVANRYACTGIGEWGAVCLNEVKKRRSCMLVVCGGCCIDTQAKKKPHHVALKRIRFEAVVKAATERGKLAHSTVSVAGGAVVSLWLSMFPRISVHDLMHLHTLLSSLCLPTSVSLAMHALLV